ncbi:MAG: lysozyme inhibitor LprI family protein [Pseudomonadota bacterium]
MIHSLAPVFLLLHSHSGTPPPNPDWDCQDPQAQQEMNWCAAQDYAVADDALNAQWTVTAAKMKARDASTAGSLPDWDERPGWFDSLLEAQRAWITYRDAHCRADGYSARGGSLEPLLVSTCKTALTEARTKELRSLADNPD